MYFILNFIIGYALAKYAPILFGRVPQNREKISNLHVAGGRKLLLSAFDYIQRYGTLNTVLWCMTVYEIIL